MRNGDLFGEVAAEEISVRSPGPPLTGKQEYRNIAQRKEVQRMHDTVKDWVLPGLPELSQFDEVVLDLETNGLRWWGGDQLIGMGLWTPDGVTRYLPVRHKVGPNHDPRTFRDWCKRELKGKKITNIRLKFDLHNLRNDDVNLAELGCTFGDVAHYAALLDDHRRAFNQEDLAKAYLGEEYLKVTAAHGYELNASKFAEYPAGMVAPRAEDDVRTVAALRDKMWPLMTAQSLHKVRDLEERVIPAVVEMEHNGAPIDLEMLDRYVVRCARDKEACLYRIRELTGVLMDSPSKRHDLLQVFRAKGVTPPLDPETDQPSFADEHLALLPQEEWLVQLRTAIALASLESKFLHKYQKVCNPSGILRYELHQLPYQDDAEGGGGAVSGRFSSAAMTYYDERGVLVKDGGNVQQVYGVKSQHNPKVDFNPTKDFIVRRLFIPGTPGAAWFCADMRQIEYRRFVHYSDAERLIQSYRDDPLTDYHVLVHGLIQQHTGKDFERTHVKNLNFASLYGAGLLKIALMTGEITRSVFKELADAQARAVGKRDWKALDKVRNDPRVAKTKSLCDTYHGMFPEVKTLLDLARTTAEERGHVMTILGRRARFGKGDRTYSALNRVIQGTAADDNKAALIDVYQERNRLGFVMRMTVHDELNGDLLDPGGLDQMAGFLNEQRLECKVPILWDSRIGANWAEAK